MNENFTDKNSQPLKIIEAYNIISKNLKTQTL